MRKKRLQKHHNKARSRFKKKAGEIFMLTPENHSCYHKLFKLRTFLEASKVLKRLSERRFKNDKAVHSMS